MKKVWLCIFVCAVVVMLQGVVFAQTPGGSSPQLQCNNSGTLDGISGSAATSAGNVGIGTVNPGAKLSVAGTMSLDSTGSFV